MSDQIRLKRGKPRDSYARVDYENGIYTVTLPPDRDDDYDLRTFLHELCHLSASVELNVWGKPFLEDIVERVLEPRLIFYIISRPAKHRWWLKRLKSLHPDNPNA